MEKAKNQLVETAEKEINIGELMAKFYKSQEDAESDKQEKARIGLKRKHIEDAVSFNKKLLAFLNTL